MVLQESARQRNAYICLLITFAAATFTLVSRVIARRLTKLRLWHDDYLAIIAYACAIVWTGLTLWWLQIGLGLYLSEISLPDDYVLEKSRLILWNVELFYAFSLAFSKFAILAFYWRMFKTSSIKLPIKILFGCTAIWLILRTFLAIFHCVPVQKFWQPELDGICNIDDSEFFFGTVLTHLILDLVILALPVIEVRKLRLPLSQRLAIISMFLFGIFVCVASVVVLVYSIQFDASSREMPYNISPIIIWATVEVNLAIVSACLPILRPVYLLIIRRPLSNSSSHPHSYPHSQPYSNSASHKLATLTTHNEIVHTTSHAKSDTESTQNLAVNEREGSLRSSSDYNPSGSGSEVRHGNHTVIVGPAEESPADDRPPRRERGGSWNDLGGIVVTNEMSVRISRIA